MKKVIITLYKLKQDKQRILGVQEYLLEKGKKKKTNLIIFKSNLTNP